MCRSGGKTPVPHFAATSLAARPQFHIVQVLSCGSLAARPQAASDIFSPFRVGPAVCMTESRKLHVHVLLARLFKVRGRALRIRLGSLGWDGWRCIVFVLQGGSDLSL